MGIGQPMYFTRGGHLVSMRVTVRDRDQDLDRHKIGLDLLIATVSGV